MVKRSIKKPTISIGQLILIFKQLENLDIDIDQVLDALFTGGNLSDTLKTQLMNAYERIRYEPVNTGVNASLYQIIYALAKKNFGPMCKRADIGLFYLKAI